MRFHTTLPVEDVLEELLEKCSVSNQVILCAEPGAGKTTLVPPALLELPEMNGKKILMLEPRRIAAAGAAGRIAFLAGEKTGGLAGLRTRFQTIVSKETRIEVITEGILTRMLQSDPELPGVGMIIFDEFHERSIHADLGLALSLEIQEALRPDLKILLMSATLDAEKLSGFLNNAPVVRSSGKVFPVETRYEGTADRSLRLEKQVASSVISVLNEASGDVLVFLPGEYEIRAAIAELHARFPDAEQQKLQFLPLYGNLPEEEISLALSPAQNGFRKVICSTPVAESGVTVPGVRIVIDSGLVRVSCFSPASGMNHLETRRISLASADQRRGRAGRTASGLCIRLWNRMEEKAFPRYDVPEILECDLTPAALELAQWGISPDTVGNLRFPDPPPEAPLCKAFELLVSIGAVEQKTFRITPHGKKILTKPMHPRLANMILRSAEFHGETLACALAAILSEKDFLRTGDPDLFLRLEALRSGRGEMDRNVFQRVRNIFRQLMPHGEFPSDFSGLPLLAVLAYPDRIALRKEEGIYVLANGSTAKLPPQDSIRKEPLICAVSAEGTGSVPLIRLAVALSLPELEQNLPELIQEEAVAEWEERSGMLKAYKVRRIGSFALERKNLPLSSKEVSFEEKCRAFLAGIREKPLPWSKREESLMERCAFLRRTCGEEFPDLSGDVLGKSLETWLAPFLTEKSFSMEALRGEILAAAFDNLLGYDTVQKIERLAPERIEVPSGSRIRIDYSANPPRLSVRLQEIFGMTDSPLLAGGKVKAVMDILSPAMRTVQITSDLAGFWRESYFDVRKEMRGRYPKHDWPENPLEAVAHRGVRRKV